MPRDGSGTYSVPANTEGVPGQPVSSSRYNAFIADLVSALNSPLPVIYGGTGVASIPDLKTALGMLTTSTDNAIARFNGTTGALQNSAATIDDTGNITVSNFTPSVTLVDTSTGVSAVLNGNSSVGSLTIQVDTGNIGSAPLFNVSIGGTTVLSITEAGNATVTGTLTVG